MDDPEYYVFPDGTKKRIGFDPTGIIRLPLPGSKLKAKLERLATEYTEKYIGKNNEAQRGALEDIRLLTKVIETL